MALLTGLTATAPQLTTAQVIDDVIVVNKPSPAFATVIISGTSSTPPSPSAPAAITVSLGTAALTTPNQTTLATAVITNSAGTVLTSGFSLLWSSSAQGIVSITPASLTTATATALATGGAAGVNITVTIAGTSFSATAVATTPATQPTTLTVNPATITLNSSVVVFLATVMTDQWGGPTNAGHITWASSDSTDTIIISGSGGLQALGGGIVSTITATSEFGPVGTCLATSAAAALTSVALSPGNVTLASGTVTEVPTPVDQFGVTWPITTGGGSVTFTSSAGVGRSANVPALATAAGLAFLYRMKVDQWAALTSFNQFSTLSLDNGTVGSATSRIALVVANNGTGLYRVGYSVPGVLGALWTGNIPTSALPPNGQDVVVYGHYFNGSQYLGVFTGAGTGTLINSNAAVAGSSFDGALPTVTNGGQVVVNDSYNGAGAATRYQGVAFFSAKRTSNYDAPPNLTGDATLLYACMMSDATSGTTPSTATAQVGSNGLVLTTSDYTWSADAANYGWNGVATSYAFTMSAPAVASVGGSSGVVAYVSAGTSTLTCTLTVAGAVAATGTALVTCGATSTPTTLALVPTSMRLSSSSTTGSVAPIVQDQNQNTLTGITVDMSVAVTLGTSTLAALAAAAGWQIGFSVNDSYESDLNYAQNYQQMNGGGAGGSVSMSEKFETHWITTVNSTTSVTTNFSEFTQEFARLQAQGTPLILYLINGAAANQWTGLTTYVTSIATANTMLATLATAVTSFFNTPGSPTAYSGSTAYAFGNTVTSGGAKWTCIIPTGTVTGVTPALGAQSGGNYCWFKTQAGTVYAYNIANEVYGFGSANSNAFTTYIVPTTWVPTFARAVYAGDSGAKIMLNNNHYAYDGTSASSSSAQTTACTTLMSDVISGGSVGTSTNCLFGIEGHTICSIMQTTTGGVGAFNTADMQSFINGLPCPYCISEFDVTDDMYEFSASPYTQRLNAIGTAYTNYLAMLAGCTNKPVYFLMFQLRCPESWINEDSISPRSDGLTQYPNIYQDYNATLTPAFTAVATFLASKASANTTVAASCVTPAACTATYVAIGCSLITATLPSYSTVPAATCLVTNVAGSSFNMPGGMTTVINTGLITSAPGTSGTPVSAWQMLSPSTPTTAMGQSGGGGIGEWSGNLTIVPANTNGYSSGWRVNYPTNVSVGYSPVRWQVGWSSGSYGTGWYYARHRFRCSPQWQVGEVAVKTFFPRNSVNNSFFGMFLDTNKTDAYPIMGIQLNGGGGTNVPLQSAPTYTYAAVIPWAQCGGANVGDWFYLEHLCTPESAAGAGNGQYDLWVWSASPSGNTLLGHYNQTGITYTKSGQAMTWQSAVWCPTFGGAGTTEPVSNMYFDVDEIVMATK